MNKEEAKKLVNNTLTAGRQALFEPEAKALVSAWGIHVPKSVLIDGLEDVALKSKEITPPLVLKVVSQDILHKREFGGVITGINDSEEVNIALKEMKRTLAEKAPKARIAGFLLEETAPTGIELIIGGLRDPQFGPAVMFGTGGFAVELVADVSFRLAPLNREEVFDMMREVKSYPLLTGFRGSKPVDLAKLASTVMKLSEILLEIEEIKEIEINPLLVYEEGAVAVDARVVLQ
uniref:acetate--CoA ligase (ADP-forming) n=1 Tax=Candidatus Methanogaster sp. ANME-2c ERB4 TaxID=2759911 RepID=A0A7G9Y0V5_9EURY|nr:acetate--CoA ligase [ADP-forming] I subunit beta [Methanosarcinales archaeon ANME-2c ERB4]